MVTITAVTAPAGKNWLLVDVGEGYTFWSASMRSTDDFVNRRDTDVKTRVLERFAQWVEPVSETISATPLGHGVFSSDLMRGLQGEAADERGIIDADSLYRYVYRQTLQYIDRGTTSLLATKHIDRSHHQPQQAIAHKDVPFESVLDRQFLKNCHNPQKLVASKYQ